MLKMFTTQLTGLFKRIQDKGEFSFEDGARLLAQAPAGDGILYIYGSREMKAVSFEAIEGEEKLDFVRSYDGAEITSADRVLLFSRFSTDEDAVTAASELKDKGILFTAVSTVVDADGGPSLDNLADVHIDLALTKGLLPDEEGNRFGFPSSIAALFVYFGLKFTIEEILAEYE